ncbi:MAG: hypothetical protein IPH37_14625 [Burkholderiales bacterium]|nr:hypothetical protein [Burkholderiales bacterium]
MTFFTHQNYTTAMRTNIVFVDSRVANYQTLIDGLNQPAEVFILNGDSMGCRR